MNQHACKCMLHQCLPMPANACQNLYIVRWTRIYIRLLLLFKNPPSPYFSTFEKKLCIHNDTVAVECVSCRFLALCTCACEIIDNPGFSGPSTTAVSNQNKYRYSCTRPQYRFINLYIIDIKFKFILSTT